MALHIRSAIPAARALVHLEEIPDGDTFMGILQQDAYVSDLIPEPWIRSGSGFYCLGRGYYYTADELHQRQATFRSYLPCCFTVTIEPDTGGVTREI